MAYKQNYCLTKSVKIMKKINSLSVCFSIFIFNLIANSILAQNSWEPPNSVITINNFKATIKAPNDWKYIGTNTSNEIIALAAGPVKTISCNCKTNGNANRFTLQEYLAQPQVVEEFVILVQ